MKITTTILFLVLVLSLGCSKPEVNPGSSGLANPASQYCEKQGYKLEIAKDSEGNEYGICKFSDGTECDEWAYYRGECKPGEKTTDRPVAESCDASIPCSEGYECVKLPDKDSPKCIKPEVLQSPEYKDCIALESYPLQIKCPDKISQVDAYACNEDSDCLIKDVHNCCGYYPRCVNKDYEPDIEAVKKECAGKGMASVCGFPEITSCKCVNNKCISM